MDDTQLPLTTATLAGHEGHIVGVDESTIEWEIELVPQQLPAFIARCGQGGALSIVTNHGMVPVRARRWWVWPGDESVVVRLALEDGSR